ncbi:MAG TPA: serine hydrolase domain-containing protein [Candidatus Sulfotelmatobacter sp.]|nr:serine hydrolase domain-containing protein [Candidatus Sulfotelmatobacter sp.]
MRVPRLLTALVAICAVCLAQPRFPNSAAGHQCAAWLDSFNRGDTNAHREFLEKNFPSQVSKLEREMRFRQMTGGLDMKKVEESTPTKIVVLVQERESDQMGRLTMEVQSDTPHQIASIDIQAIPRPAEFALPYLSQSETVAAARKYIEKQVAADNFSGAVMITKDGKTVFAEAYGMANRESKVPNTLQTRFRIGSMNKMFSAVATLQLAQARKLELKETVGKYLTDYPNQDIATKVTLQQLLTHTGGTGDIFGPEFETHRLELRTIADYIALYGNRGPKFEPGTRWEYSNYGFILLGAIIEKVSGQSYYGYVREHIFEPARMTSTGSEPEDKAIPDRSMGYTKIGSAWAPNTDTLPYRGTSAGGGYSTVEDLTRFAEAIKNHKLLDVLYTGMLTTGKPGTPNMSYAYGFEDRLVHGIRCFGHGGGAPGMNGDLKICPETGYVVAVLANLDPPAATRVSEFILNRLP